MRGFLPKWMSSEFSVCLLQPFNRYIGSHRLPRLTTPPSYTIMYTTYLHNVCILFLHAIFTDVNSSLINYSSSITPNSYSYIHTYTHYHELHIIPYTYTIPIPQQYNKLINPYLSDYTYITIHALLCRMVPAL